MWFLLLLLVICLQRSLSKQTFVLQNRNEIIRIIYRHQKNRVNSLPLWSAQSFVQYEAEESSNPNFDLCMVSVQTAEHMEMLCRAV